MRLRVQAGAQPRGFGGGADQGADAALAFAPRHVNDPQASLRIAEFRQQSGRAYKAVLERRAASQACMAFEVGVAVEPGQRVGVGIEH